MRLNFYIITLLIFPLLTSLADTYEERNFNIDAKFGIFPSINVMEINTKLKTKEENFDYIFDIKSKNIVKFINETSGKGIVSGKIVDNKYIPSRYEYSYKRKEKNKYIEILYRKNVIEKITIKPRYDQSKLTPLTDQMLINTIDPPTFFLSILNYKNLDNCNKVFRVFDGKRRYDVKFNKLSSSSSDLIQCEAKQIKLGGYKKKEDDVFATSDFIKIIYDNNKNNNFLRYEAKNGSINIIIKEIAN
tara:strand:+ start:408 stop:1145 length:738 start_codon:yes stop_codon:yes gene_type:complete